VGSGGPARPGGRQVLDVSQHVAAPDQIDAAVRFGQPLRDALLHVDAGGHLGLAGREGLQGAGGALQVAAHRLDAVHGEPEPARQLDAVAGLAGPDVTGQRPRRQPEPGGSPSPATRSNSRPEPRGARLWSTADAKASYSAKADPKPYSSSAVRTRAGARKHRAR
jgi:hypothetical protein